MIDPTVRADVLRRVRGTGGSAILAEFEKMIRADERRIVLADLQGEQRRQQQLASVEPLFEDSDERFSPVSTNPPYWIKSGRHG